MPLAERALQVAEKEEIQGGYSVRTTPRNFWLRDSLGACRVVQKQVLRGLM